MTRVMKAVSVVAVCIVALMMAPQEFAQGPPPPPVTQMVAGNLPPCGDPDLTTCPSLSPFGTTASFANVPGLQAQAFSLASPAYISGIELWMNPFGSVGSSESCGFQLFITNSLVNNGSFGNVFLSRSETVVFTPTNPFLPSATMVYDGGFGGIWLAAGNYWLVATLPSCPGGNTGAWRFASVGSSGVNSGSSCVSTETTWDCDGPPDAFALFGPIIPPPTGGGKFERVRYIVEGPITPPAGGPVEAQVGFVNVATGNLVGPLTPITINPGPSQLQSVDLDLTPLVARVGQRLEVQPVIVQSPNATGASNPGPVQISGTVQVFDELTGFQAVSAPVPQPGAAVGKNPGPDGVSAFSPQILAGGQTMRLDVMATPFDACVGQVSFNDGNGVALIPAVQVNLTPGTGTTVDLNADALNFRIGQEIEVQPVLTLTAPAAAAPQNSVCNASVEVFDHFTGRTWSHQDTMVGLPAVQTPAAGTPGVPTSAAGTQ